MNAWTLAIANLANLPQPEPMEVISTGRCAYCGDTLPLRRKKYCTDEHMRTHHNSLAPTTRAGRMKKS